MYLRAALGVHDRRIIRAYRSTGLTVEPVVLCTGDATDGHGEIDAAIAPDGTSLRAIARRFQPTIVQAGPLTPVAETAMRELPDYPLLAVSWAFDVLGDCDHVAIRSVLQHAKALHCDCQTVYDVCRRLAGHIPTIIFPWGLEKAPAIGRAPPRRFTRLITLRSFEQLYLPHVAIEAAKILSRSTDAYQLDMYGTGSLYPSMRAIARPNVHFRGHVPENAVRHALATAHCYVSTSPIDGTSVSLLEAMRAGAIPILPDIPSNREWVVHGLNGWLYAPGSATDLAASVLDARSDISRWPTIRSLNRQLVRRRANLQQNIARFTQLLHDRPLAELSCSTPIVLSQ